MGRLKSGFTGRFEGTLDPDWIDGNKWELDQTEHFRLCVDGIGTFEPPDRFVVDFASIPLVIRWLYPKTGKGKRGQYGPGAVIHDRLYSNPKDISDQQYARAVILLARQHIKLRDKRELADRFFLLGMEIKNVRGTLRRNFYRAVRIGGRKYFGHPDDLNKLRSK